MACLPCSHREVAGVAPSRGRASRASSAQPLRNSIELRVVHHKATDQNEDEHDQIDYRGDHSNQIPCHSTRIHRITRTIMIAMYNAMIIELSSRATEGRAAKRIGREYGQATEVLISS